MIGQSAEDYGSCYESPEMAQMREWVTEDDHTRYDKQAGSTLRLDVTHSNLVSRFHDLVFDSCMTIERVKEKLYRHGGTPVNDQELYLRRGGSDIIFLYDERKTLGDYGTKNGHEIHIKDINPHSISAHGGLEDVSQVEKYVMAEEDYDKLDNSVRALKKKAFEKAQREAAEEYAARKAAGEDMTPVPEAPEETAEEVAAKCPVGSRCEVAPGGRRGEVAYVGPVKGVKGIWVGARLDEPQGNNNGQGKDGKQLFECKGDKYGCFAKAENVVVGDFPERDPFASESEDEF
ncbi:unnamed protein product [Polarella glacialis]|uniref:Tubulin-folding cofactor B n=1 Tax=Polarella glacialis TaxID=89957 RepID=A0A813DX53_POLGL|nr:unnamed protein product [Polarella glacialis]|mmetsp:Transcript_20558/g.36469  ORF Transcript_20558/g.36469 Transcript_20558/m.36469 type:complete len:290 (+) Transcript_20558:117-986(+)